MEDFDLFLRVPRGGVHSSAMEGEREFRSLRRAQDWCFRNIAPVSCSAEHNLLSRDTLRTPLHVNHGSCNTPDTHTHTKSFARIYLHVRKESIQLCRLVLRVRCRRRRSPAAATLSFLPVPRHLQSDHHGVQ